VYVSVSGYYVPKRDIPIAVRELKTLSPSRIRDWIRNHKIKREKISGKRVQHNLTSQSISMWFKRHPKIKTELKEKIREQELSREAVSESIFQNGVFQEILSIKNWIMKLRARGAKESSIGNFVRAIRQICMGDLPHKQHIENWGLKHPDYLNVKNGLEYISELQKRGLRTRRHKLALRNFLKSKNVKGWDEISGELEEAEKYADLFTSRENIYHIFEWLKARNRTAYLASKFAFKTAARLGAVLAAHASYINFHEHKITVFEKAKARRKKRRVVKKIPEDLWDELPKEGKLFNIKAEELNSLLKAAYKEVIPELADRIPMPFHFWRHMFAQHMLRKTNWNYGLVARLGGWTVGALERYYGKMGEEQSVELGNKYLLNL
jgi:integrase